MSNFQNSFSPVTLANDEWIYFLHIPKTAGTSLYMTLKNLFSEKNILLISDNDLHYYFKNTRPEDFSSLKFSRQHAFYDYYSHFTKKPHYITMLRDPVERAFSLFHHICRVSDHSQHIPLKEKNNDPKYFFSELGKMQISNFQVRSLVGYFEKHNELSDTDLLEIAKLRLNHFAFFGIQEKYEKSIQLLEKTFGWNSLSITFENTGRTGSKNRDPEITEMVQSKNKLDQALYDYALDLFEQKYKSAFMKK